MRVTVLIYKNDINSVCLWLVYELLFITYFLYNLIEWYYEVSNFPIADASALYISSIVFMDTKLLPSELLRLGRGSVLAIPTIA
jgi:hypothetical protein